MTTSSDEENLIIHHTAPPPPSSPSYKYVPDHMISMVMWPNAVLILKKFNFLFRVE